MAKSTTPTVRPTGSVRLIADQPHEVPALGYDSTTPGGARMVEPDELVEVRAELLDPRAYHWTPAIWDVVDDAGWGDHLVAQQTGGE